VFGKAHALCLTGGLAGLALYSSGLPLPDMLSSLDDWQDEPGSLRNGGEDVIEYSSNLDRMVQQGLETGTLVSATCSLLDQAL
jgi:hypothetical protein